MEINTTNIKLIMAIALNVMNVYDYSEHIKMELLTLGVKT